jgi:Family of unknown function (DUF5343)
MESSLPYVYSPGSIKTALERIRQAATPDRVTRDFVTTKLSIKGGTGAAMIPFLKKIGLVNSDGTPTDLYKQFRNPATGGAAIAAAIKVGYKKLSQVNEYFYDLSDKDLQALIVEVTGSESGSSVVKLTFSTLKFLRAFANFEASQAPDGATAETESTAATRVGAVSGPKGPGGELGLNFSYTINLNLPATSDQAVFNAIFRSLKEHLLSNVES